jgi:hypothetical protein
VEKNLKQTSEVEDQEEYGQLSTETLRTWLEILFTFQDVDENTFELKMEKDSYFLSKIKQYYGFKSYDDVVGKSPLQNLTNISDIQPPEDEKIVVFTSISSPARLFVKFNT